MTALGILQIAVYFLASAGCHETVGRLHGAPVQRRADLPASGAALARSAHLQSHRRSRGRGAALDPVHGVTARFSIFGFLLTYLLQRAQAYLPFNPQNFGTPNVTPDLAFNTAVSFVTNTNWQAYCGESTLSYFVQMAALTVQNFALGRRRHRDRDRADSRLRAAAR